MKDNGIQKALNELEGLILYEIVLSNFNYKTATFVTGLADWMRLNHGLESQNWTDKIGNKLAINGMKAITRQLFSIIGLRKGTEISFYHIVCILKMKDSLCPVSRKLRA